MKKHKTLVISIISILGIFIIINAMWFLYYKKFDKHIENIKDDGFGVFVVEQDGYSYSVKKPYYLSFVGNLAITKNASNESLLIWINLFRDHEYGVQLMSKDAESYNINIDEKGDLIPEKSSTEAQAVLDQNKEDVWDFINRANNFWTLN